MLIEAAILAIAAVDIVSALAVARAARLDLVRLRAARVNGGAIITARYLLQTERMHVFQIALVLFGAAMRLLRPDFRVRELMILYLLLDASRHLIRQRAQADAAAADRAHGWAGHPSGERRPGGDVVG